MMRRSESPLKVAKQYISTGEDQPGFKSRLVKNKGKGVFTTRSFEHHDFLLEYKGKFLTTDVSICDYTYVYPFNHAGKTIWIDGTVDDGSYSRLINDEHKYPNCVMKKIIHSDGNPRLCLFSLRHISKGEELSYNYGMADYPWRNKKEVCTLRDNANSRSPTSYEYSADSLLTSDDDSATDDDSVNSCPPSDSASVDPQLPCDGANSNINPMPQLDVFNVDSMPPRDDSSVYTMPQHDSSVHPIPPRDLFSVDPVSQCDEPSVDPMRQCDDSSGVLLPLCYDSSDVQQQPSCTSVATNFESESTLSETDKDMSDSKKTKFPEIDVPCYSRGKDGKRIYDKKQACYFCDKLQMKIARHLNLVHCQEPEVAKVLASTGRARELGLEKLRLMGNFHHNIRVLTEGKGTLLVSRRSNKKKVAENFLPCFLCFAFIDTCELWRHVRNCKQKDININEAHEQDGSQPNTTIISKCRMLLEGANTSYRSSHQNYSEVKSIVIFNMREDDVKAIISDDDMILNLGTIMLHKLGESKRYQIAQKMRQLSRLLKVMRTLLGKPGLNLFECIDGAQFDNVIKATKMLCVELAASTMSGVQMMKSPSIGLHIGHSLVKCSMIKMGRAIRLKDVIMKQEAVSFAELHTAEWTDKVSSLALKTLKERKFSKSESLPLTTDLKKLSSYTAGQLQAYFIQLQQAPCMYSWVNLAKAVYVAVTIFNKRRGGEVAKMHMKCYTERPMSKEANQEILLSLNALETKLLSRFEVVHLPGKRNRKVPLLLKTEWIEAMDLLVKLRKQCHISIRNIYFFASSNWSNSHLNAWQVIHGYAVNAGCEKSDRISTTRLRKYSATVLQVLALKEGELEWLTNHLGHNINIHKEVYRLQENTIEISKVSKVLLAMESGQINCIKGKSLEEIDVDDIDIQDNDEKAEIEDYESNDEDSNKHHDAGERSNQESEEPNIIAESRDNEVVFKNSEHKRKHIDSETSDEDYEPKLRRKKRKRIIIYSESSDDEHEFKVTYKKRKWTDEENKVFYRRFRVYLQEKTMPPGITIQHAAKELTNRTIPQIRAKVHNIIKGKQLHYVF